MALVKPSACTNTTQPTIYTDSGKSWANDQIALAPGAKRHPQPINRSFNAISTWIDGITYAAGSTAEEKAKIDASKLMGALSLVGTYDAGYVKIGSWYFWEDTTDTDNKLIRCKSSAPSSMTDGTNLYLAGKDHLIASTTSTSLQNNTWTKIAYAEEITNNNFTDGTYTAPATGYYRINAQAWLAASDALDIGESFMIGIYKNGALYRDAMRIASEVSSTTSIYWTSAISVTEYLSAGDTIDIYGYQVSGGAWSLFNDIKCNFLMIDQL